MKIQLTIECLKQSIKELRVEQYQLERNGLAKSSLDFIDIIDEQINEFTIGFQYWLLENCTLNMRIWTYKKDTSRIYEMIELLKMYENRNIDASDRAE